MTASWWTTCTTADPEVTETSGVAVHPNDKVTLTARYDRDGGVAVASLPAITSLVDHEERTTAVQADGKSMAVLDYAPSGLFAAVTLPARLTWKVSAPDSSGRVRQSMENASGKVIASVVMTDVEGVRPGAWYDLAAAELGVALDSLTYEQSPTGLTTARNTNGRVAFYVVHVRRCDVGFSPDGRVLFYDLMLSVFGGTIAPGSDIMVSPAADAQSAAVPDHFVLTAGGGSGLYVKIDRCGLDAWRREGVDGHDRGRAGLQRHALNMRALCGDRSSIDLMAAVDSAACFRDASWFGNYCVE
jgi:hypothetical protein